ncbi:MAG: metallophosphoesterase [Phycisphaerales bacterium]
MPRMAVLILWAALIGMWLSPSVPCALAQQPADGNKQDGRGRRGPLAEMTAFKTDVPSATEGHPFDIVLVRPTRDSMTVSVVCYEKDAMEGYVEYRRDDSAHLDRCATQPLPAGETVLFTLEHLRPDTAYVYRFKHRRVPGKGTPEPTATGAFSSSAYYTFHTPRALSSAFTFTIQADSHLDANVTPAVYLQTLANALADKPDFHLDLGDTFMTDKRGKNFKDTLPQYIAQRYYFGQLCHSAPLFMVLGNHDGEVGYANAGPDSMAAWSFAQRNKCFPAPEIEDIADGKAMYSGRTSYAKGQGANYYEFTWGDAHFIVLDPFWFTTTRPRGGGGGGPGRDKKEADVANTDENWTRTLGKDQYDWLTRTLDTSKSKYTFVFIHHLVGGLGKANRGGVEASVLFEWGGKNADGSDGFAEHRPGWAMPIHDLLVKHHVSAVFHGHDHLYVRGERDGLVYQCVPQPGNVAGGTRSAAEYGYMSGTILGSPGHVRVRVGLEQASVEFIRSAVVNADEPGNRRGGARNAEVNGTVLNPYNIAPAEGK